MNKKKILFVITKSNWGGAQRYVYDLATNLPKMQFDVVVACGGEGLFKERLIHEHIRVIDVPFLARDINLLNDFKAFFALQKIFREERPDIVHLNSTKIGGLGALAGRLARVPKIIFTAHGWVFNESRNVIWELFTYTLSWITVLLAHTTITISYKEEGQALAFPLVKSSKLAMVYIAAGDIAYKDRVSARRLISVKTNQNVPEKTVWVGSIGELHRNKGYRYALEAFKELKEEGVPFFYCIIGEGEERDTLEEYVRDAGLEDAVVLAGAIPDATSGATLMKAFDIFLLPSTKEGLPYVILEAGNAGIPVIATFVGGVPEIVSHGESGLLVLPGDTDTLKQAIKTLLFDERIRRSYSEKLTDTIKEKFSLLRMVRETVRIYES